MQADEMTEHGDRVLIVGRLRGRGRETGMELDSPVAFVATIDRDNKVASWHTYPDVAEGREAAELGG